MLQQSSRVLKTCIAYFFHTSLRYVKEKSERRELKIFRGIYSFSMAPGPGPWQQHPTVPLMKYSFLLPSN